MAYTYEGATPIFYCVISGIAHWNNNGPFDKIAEIWEKKFIEKKRLTVAEQSYVDVYSDAVKDYTNLVIWYSNLTERQKNNIYKKYQKSLDE
jgi:hypothetical protein